MLVGYFFPSSGPCHVPSPFVHHVTEALDTLTHTPVPFPCSLPPTAEMDRTKPRTACAAFGNASREWDPARNLGAAPFLTKEHALTSNAAIFSPGPIYLPQWSKSGSVRTPLIWSGPSDRFYDRFEQGRVN